MDALSLDVPATVRPPAALLDRIMSIWQPEEVWLFGSRARGSNHPGSDWDLFVVVPDSTPDALLDPGDAWMSVRDLKVPVDLIPVRRSEFEEGRARLGSLSQIVTTEGRRVDAR